MASVVYCPLEQGAVEVGGHAARERREIGPHVGPGLDLQAEEPAAGVEGELHVGLMVAPVRVGDEGFGPIRGPLDWPPDLSRRPQNRRFLLVDEDLGPESATYVGSDDVQLVFGCDLDEGGQHEAVDVRVLARQAQGVVAGRGVVASDRGPRLHRIRDEPVVDEVEARHVVGAGEGVVRRRAVADLPVIAEVAGRVGVDLRRPFRERVLHGHQRREAGVAHLHLLRRVARLAGALRDHDGHRVSDVAHRIDGENRMGPAPCAALRSCP